MPFNRPPRLQTPLPAEVVKLPEFPKIPQKPEKHNLLTILLPLGAVLLSVVLMMTLMNRGGSGLSYLMFIPIMLVSYLAAFFTGRTQKKNYAKKVEEGKATLQEDLQKFEGRLVELKRQEQQLRLSIDPPPADCLQRAQKQDPRLGERRPWDPDFLHLRLGMGNTPTIYSIEPLNKERIEEFGEEYTRLEKMTKSYTRVEAPIQARLPLTGSIGISGTHAETLGLCRAMMCHLLVHHWPSEVKVAAVYRPGNMPDWKWLAQLPHVSPVMKDATPEQTTQVDEPNDKVMAALEVELQRREQQVEAHKLMKREDTAGQPFIPLPRLVVIFDYLPVTYNHPALNLLHKKGSQLGVYGIFLTEQARDIPGDCGAVVRCKGGRLLYSESGTSGYKRESSTDILSLAQIDGLAHALTLVEWPTAEDKSQPPDTITFLQLFGATNVEDLPIETWWEEKPPHGYLRAPIGRISATSDMIFDLNDRDGAHGPHGLLGGMTGSGKSEVLKAIILALAVTHHPYDLNFALIDFKGGAAFNELARLPHTVGVVTDIESNATFAERVVQALSGEIERRKVVLESARKSFRFGRSHIDEYRKLPVRRPMPRLVIVFDEFAEFKQRNPVESKKLISIARQGRSLGVHLILATQNIAAAVDPEILQNSSFRICLKVSEPQDSMQMVGIPDAINLTRGRAYFSSNARVLYQSAFSGARYDSKDDAELPNAVVRVWPDGRRETLDVPRRSGDSSSAEITATEASAVVEEILRVARKLHLKKTPSVWPDALSERLYLPDLLNKYLTGGWDGKEWRPCQRWGAASSTGELVYPIFGLGDLPSRQTQFPVQVDASRGGHLLVFGSAGSGKSTMLRSLVTSLALTQSPAEAQVYILDFGGQSALKILEGFPHVGAVATRLETERAERLVQLIQVEVARRNDLMRSVHVDNWTDYNMQALVEKRFPALYLVIDGFRDLKQAFENEFIASISSLVSGGQAAGLYMILASSLQNDIPNDLFANVNMRLTYNQADPTEYYRIVGQPSEAKLQEDTAKGTRPGRGLLRGTPPLEFHTALPTYGDTDKEQAENLIALAEQMRQAWKGTLPAPVRILPLLVTLPKPAEYLTSATRPYFSMLGLDFEALSPMGFPLMEDGPTFLVSSTTGQSGKTTLLHTWLLGLAERYTTSELKVVLVDFHSRSMARLRRLPIVTDYVGNRPMLDSTLGALLEEIDKRQKAIEKEYESDPEKFDQDALLRKWPHILMMIDDYDRFFQANGAEVPQMVDCLRRGGELGFSFVIASNIRDLPNSYTDHFVERFRKYGCGILLGGADGLDEYNNTRRPPGAQMSGLPAGRGYLVRRGKASLVQAAAYWQKNQEPLSALEERVLQTIKNNKPK